MTDYEKRAFLREECHRRWDLNQKQIAKVGVGEVGISQLFAVVKAERNELTVVNLQKLNER